MELIPPIQHRDRAVLDPHRDGAREQAPDLLGGRCGGEVEIMVLETEQVVADGAADAPRLVARFLKRAGDVQDFRWNRQ
jgi:hypothetical protein